MSQDKPKYTYKIRQKRLSRFMYATLLGNWQFALLFAAMVVCAFFVQGHPWYAHWFGFLISCYGLIGNDSIQTLGVFITSNGHHRPWWVLWSYIATIFMITVGVSWGWYAGSVTYQRLSLEEVKEISFGQLMAPIALILLTRIGLPVSTTFLLLSTFVHDTTVIGHIVYKSFCGYVVAFVASSCAWSLKFFLSYKKKEKQQQKSPIRAWFIVQWISSGALWSVWLVQDGANMSIFLPRSMPTSTFLGFVLCICLLLAAFFYQQGGSMQKIVNVKTGITDIRAASSVNGFYLCLLLPFTVYSKTPMSTTWLFIGLLGGRELATSIWLTHKNRTKKQAVRKSLYLILRDVGYAIMGLVVSIGLSLWVNPDLVR